MIGVTFTVTTVDDLTGGTDVTAQLDSADCRVRLNEEGIGGVIVPYGQTITPDPIGRVVVVRFDGTPAFAWYCNKVAPVEVGQGEEASMVTEYSGPGLPFLLNRYRFHPTLGADRSPWARTRTFSAFSPEYDFSSWAAATEYGAVGDESTYWTGMPEGFPSFDTAWIGPSEGDDSAGPYGYWWTQTEFTLDVAGPVVFFLGVDDFCDFYIDGFRLASISTDRDPTSGYRQAHTFPVYLSAGTHRIGARVVNNFGVGDPGYGEGDTIEGNPTGLALVGYVTDGAGRLGEKLIETSGAWKILAYPDDPPGMTEVEVLETLVAECVAQGVSPEFTVVSHGTHSPRETITVRVGGGGLRHLRDRAEGSFIDWEAPPTTLEVHVWPAGERGSVSGVEFSTENRNLASLDYNQREIGTTGLWVAHRNGWSFVGTGAVVDSLETEASTFGEAKQLGELVLDRDPTPQQIRADIAPFTGEVPGVDFDCGDTVTLGEFTERVIGWSMTWDAEYAGEPDFDLEVKDRIRGEEERLALMVAHAAPGQLGGTAPASPAADPPEFGSKIRQGELEWSVNKPDDTDYATGEAPLDKIPTSSGNLYAFRLTLKALTSGTFTMVYKVDGTTVATASITSSTPNLTVTEAVDPIVWLEGGKSRTTIEITSVGVGAEGAVAEGLVV